MKSNTPHFSGCIAMRGVANSLRMPILLHTALRRWFFLLLVLCVSGGLAFAAARAWTAERWNATSDPRLWLRAAKMEPGNAEYWDHLGRYALLDFTTGDLSRAVGYLERAARVNPRSDDIWMDLASAYEASGNPGDARRAYDKAEADHPISATVAWRYGNFLVRQGRNSEGFSQMRRAITSDPSLTEAAVSECWEASGNAEDLNEVLPEKSSYYATALNFFLSRNNLDAALHVWSRLLRLGHPFPMEPALDLTGELITANRVADAQKTWQETLAAEHWPQSADRGDNLIFNGGFEHRPTGGGFDWREQPVPGVSYALDRAVAHSGIQSMRITFDGSANLNFSQLAQYVAVEPKKSYLFTAYIRTQGITTDSGVGFAIDDLGQPSKAHVLTANLLGTHPWTRVEAEIATGPNSDLLAVSLRRIPSQKFDNKLRGTVWVDDISLAPERGDAAEVRRR